MDSKDLVKFSLLVGLFGILSDSTIGHALIWENDPYWTYWITKTFLIITVFAIGTAWIGIGAKKGAIITLFHTIILSLYYWTFSPVGLPDTPQWLDLDHAWTTGIPIHFLVIYIGYLLALWFWRAAQKNPDVPATMKSVMAVAASAVILVLIIGVGASLAVSQFVGVTWFIARLLIAIPFLLAWRAYIGNRSAVLGGFILALIFAAYSHYAGPMGLPGEWRLFSNFVPKTIISWPNYNQLWFLEFPIFFIVGWLTIAAQNMTERGKRSNLKPLRKRE